MPVQSTRTIGRVVHIKDEVEGAIYIGRENRRHGLEASPFANPFRIGKYMTREQAIDSYRAHFERGGLGLMLAPQLPELRDKPLACWCRHDGEEKSAENACHGDVLLELLDRYTDDELRAMGGAS